jgi:peptidylprolyl isomerase
MTASEKPLIEIPPDRDPPAELETEELRVGDGEEAVAGRYVEVHYVGVSWATGREFDSSWDRGKPFEFPLGQRHVIAGWDEGVTGMKVGGRRRLTIPPRLAYGERGAGDAIGPNETLVFVVDLVAVE